MEKIQYTGLNYAEVQAFTDDRVLAPYEGIGFSMLTILTDDGMVTANEGDWICKEADGSLSVVSE